MKSTTFAFLLCVFCGAQASTEGKDHPIVKVINLLEGLKSKSIAEGKEEAVAYEKFVYWCTTSKDTLNDAIADEKERIAEETDKIAGLKKQIESLEEDIATLDEQIKDNEADAKEAKRIRKKEARLYAAAHQDLTSTIRAVDGCIKALNAAESK